MHNSRHSKGLSYIFMSLRGLHRYINNGKLVLLYFLPIFRNPTFLFARPSLNHNKALNTEMLCFPFHSPPLPQVYHLCFILFFSFLVYSSHCTPPHLSVLPIFFLQRSLFCLFFSLLILVELLFSGHHVNDMCKHRGSLTWEQKQRAAALFFKKCGAAIISGALDFSE